MLSWFTSLAIYERDQDRSAYFYRRFDLRLRSYVYEYFAFSRTVEIGALPYVYWKVGHFSSGSPIPPPRFLRVSVSRVRRGGDDWRPFYEYKVASHRFSRLKGMKRDDSSRLLRIASYIATCNVHCVLMHLPGRGSWRYREISVILTSRELIITKRI